MVLLAGGHARAETQDAINLQLSRGPASQQVTLSWTGNQPTFEVYRSANPGSITDPANKLGETNTRAWKDLFPPDTVFYLVTRKPDPAAAIIPGAEDRKLLSGTVLAPSGPLEGEVLVEGNLITCVASSCSGQPGAAGATIIMTNGIILPGLIDSHNHGLYNIFDESDWTPLQFYTNHNQWPAETRYQQMVDAKQYLGHEGGSPVDYRCEMDKYAEIKALIAGTTSFLLAPGAVSLSCYASVVRTIDTAQNDLPADKIQTSVAIPDNTTAQSVCNNFASGTTNAYVVHVAEGTDQTARNEFTTLASRAGGCLLSPKTTIVHGTALGSTEFATMAAHNMKLVWSPKSNMFLYNDTARIDLAIQAGVSTIALAPDWSLGGSVNMLDELRFADATDQTKFGDILTPQRLFDMVTIDAAKALAVDGLLGSLEVGKRADIAVIGGYRPEPYNALILATPTTVRLVMVDGRALYGDGQLIAVGPSLPGCETVSVCDASKFMCIAETSTSNKLNQTYEQIRQNLVGALSDYDAMVGPMGIAPFSPIAPITRCP